LLQAAVLLGRFPFQKMPQPGMAAQDFPRFGDLESLGGRLSGFYFWHFILV